ncbi:hypothetical protein BOSE62_40696 [Bosea sp. 62]|nr:hypothetical protein BOSE46_120085 [Bosea sp. 46]VXB44455.1 hypothetical protein BOSE29B_110252 [Bosea sp. 29B]VXB87588.1 hypothetical protein BOSE125_160040 [Bosea sp. 125]VXC53645.1 hypothetical protein BOSE62_40696 [Bosea sp. 62]
MGQGQGLPDLRPARPLAGDPGRDRRRAESRHVARSRRRARPERLDQDDDLRRRLSRPLYQPVHAARSGRRHHHRHTARRRPRLQAAALPQGRRDRRPRHRGPRHAEAALQALHRLKRQRPAAFAGEPAATSIQRLEPKEKALPGLFDLTPTALAAVPWHGCFQSLRRPFGLGNLSTCADAGICMPAGASDASSLRTAISSPS